VTDPMTHFSTDAKRTGKTSPSSTSPAALRGDNLPDLLPLIFRTVGDMPPFDVAQAGHVVLPRHGAEKT